jgi:predicted branched-subunit amino acid permease
MTVAKMKKCTLATHLYDEIFAPFKKEKGRKNVKRKGFVCCIGRVARQKWGERESGRGTGAPG